MTCKYYNFFKYRRPIPSNLCNKCLECIYPKHLASVYKSCKLCGEINVCLFMLITSDTSRYMVCSKCIYLQNYIIPSCSICENIHTKKIYIFLLICIFILFIPDSIYIIIWASGVYMAKEIMYLLYY